MNNHEIEEAFLNAFPNYSSLEQMLQHQMNESLEAVAGTGSLKVVIFDLIKWAKSQGNLEQLIQGAKRENSGNPKLMKIGYPEETPPPKPNHYHTEPNNQKRDLSYCDTIESMFVQRLEKELAMNQSKYFRKTPPVIAESGSINYLAILYLSQESADITSLSNQIRDLCDQVQSYALSDQVEKCLRENLNEIVQHKDLTAGLIKAALQADPNHYLGKSLAKLFQMLGDSVAEVKISLMKDNEEQLLHALGNLVNKLDCVADCMQETYDYLETLLHN